MGKKRKSPKQWGFVDHANLCDFDTMRNSVESFMYYLEENGFSQRVRTYQKFNYYAEITKDCERYAFAMINGKGDLFIANEEKPSWCISHYIHGHKSIWKRTSLSNFLTEYEFKGEQE
ncbi:hypothetical protein [Enterococcus mundtii]|uniref:hypothetical protein n=1 Tax=Enterococcus mundtii TaxID=53346 RepID=UPI001A97C4AF|nr:hypothetical protein [Enterococcus mundtii]MBO1087198.1 hypothetical protein [Enterococcus mundtii]